MTRLALIGAGLLALTATACTTPNKTVDVALPFTNVDQYKSASEAQQADLSFIPPTDPRYSENGAPRAGEPTGISVAGDPAVIGDGKTYAPISHRHHRW